MIRHVRSAERYHADHGWLSTWHHFSFNDYYGLGLEAGDQARITDEPRLALEALAPADVILVDPP